MVDEGVDAVDGELVAAKAEHGRPGSVVAWEGGRVKIRGKLTGVVAEAGCVGDAQGGGEASESGGGEHGERQLECHSSLEAAGEEEEKATADRDNGRYI